MTDYQHIANQIPITYNIFSFFIFTGIVLGLMVCISLCSKKIPDNRSNYILAGIVLMLSLTMADFFLSQTGLMKYVIRLNNSTEVCGLLIPIGTYFFILEILNPRKENAINFKWHLIIPCLYFFTQLPDFFAPKAIHLNYFIGSFHPHLPTLKIEKSLFVQIASVVNQFFHHILIITFLVYGFLSAKTIWTYNKKMKQNFFQSQKIIHKLNFSVYLVILLALTVGVAMFTFLKYQSDLGEQYLMLIPLIGIFALSFLLMLGLPIFDKNWLLEKYHTSGLNISSSDILEKITAYVEHEKYYLKKNSSLKNLAAELSLSPTYLSQIINSQSHQNFNDFINYYRIEEAKKRLLDEAFRHLSITGIGETVGFKSKSSFYSVFKKHTKFTPAGFIKATKIEKTPKSSPKS